MGRAIRTAFVVCFFASVSACGPATEGSSSSVRADDQAQRVALAFAEAMRENDYQTIVELDAYVRSDFDAAERRVKASSPQSMWDDQIAEARAEIFERETRRLRRRAQGTSGHRFSPLFSFFRTGTITSIEETDGKVFLEISYLPGGELDDWNGANLYPAVSDREGVRQVEKLFLSLNVTDEGQVGLVSVVEGSLVYRDEPLPAEFTALAWRWRRQNGRASATISAKLMGDAALDQARISDATCRSQSTGAIYSFSGGGGRISTYGPSTGMLVWSEADAAPGMPSGLFPAWCSITASSNGRTATGVVEVGGPDAQNECWLPRNLFPGLLYTNCSAYDGEIYPLAAAQAAGWVE